MKHQPLLSRYTGAVVGGAAAITIAACASPLARTSTEQASSPEAASGASGPRAAADTPPGSATGNREATSTAPPGADKAQPSDAAGYQSETPVSVTPPQEPAAPVLSAAEQREIDSLARWVLGEGVFGRRSLPDIALLPERGPLFLLTTASTPLTKRAFPPAGKRQLILMQLAGLQSLADQLGATVAFIVLEISVESDTAVVRSGVDIVLPSSSTDSKLCCCSTWSRWVKRKGRWRPDPKDPQHTICG